MDLSGPPAIIIGHNQACIFLRGKFFIYYMLNVLQNDFVVYQRGFSMIE